MAVGQGRGSEAPNFVATSSGDGCDELTNRLFVNKDEHPVEVTEDHIRSILCVRRGREAALGRHLFSDPAWDILLELYAAHLGARTMSVEEIARSIDVPASTTARWITVLSESELLLTAIDGLSSSEMRVALSAEGERAMKRLVDYWGAAFRSI